MAWTPEHRQNVGKLVENEIERRGWKRGEAARQLGVESRTLLRVRTGSAEASPAMYVGIAEKLGISAEQLLPPRSADEQKQLDRIEALLERLVSTLEPAGATSPLDEAVAGVEQEAQRIATTPREDAPKQKRPRRSGRAA